MCRQDSWTMQCITVSATGCDGLRLTLIGDVAVATLGGPELRPAVAQWNPAHRVTRFALDQTTSAGLGA
jgi:hypothetical protein